MDHKSDVLVVEDDPILLRAMQRVLGLAGFRAEGVANGTEAIRCLERGQFDAIVSDVAMPGLDGIQLLSAIRAGGIDTPVILVTAMPSITSAASAVQYRAFRYLLKPVDSAELVEIVTQATELNRHVRAARQGTAVDAPKSARSSLNHEFSKALANIWIAFQPIVDWPNRRVVAYEALMRAKDTELLTPNALLHAAEQLGKLFELGRAVRSQVAAHSVELPQNLRLFVNLHTSELLDDQLFLESTPLAAFAKHVVLEITERVSLDEVTDVKARIAHLRKLGYQIAIDDLGSGYSNLNSFAYLAPDVVKLDMSLVRDINENAMKQRLVASLISFCNDTGLELVAEGVETTEERDTLAGLGCRLLQGYLFAIPGRGFSSVKF